MAQSILEVLEQEKSQKKFASFDLGFFSKPVLITEGEWEGKIVKSYPAQESKELCDKIFDNHSKYVKELSATGVKLPLTEMQIIQDSNQNYKIVIIQDAFSQNDLIRNQMAKAPDVDSYLKIIQKLLDDTMMYIRHFGEPMEVKHIGFHPTLRNYAVENGEPYYFDTFPPMSMTQEELEEIIPEFTPYPLPKFIKKIAIKKWLKQVTDEYYQIDKMLIGIFGSACRLRPEFAEKVLIFMKTFAETELTNPVLKEKVLHHAENPPQLSGSWVFFRKVFGKKGKPNV